MLILVMVVTVYRYQSRIDEIQDR